MISVPDLKLKGDSIRTFRTLKWLRLLTTVSCAVGLTLAALAFPSELQELDVTYLVLRDILLLLICLVALVQVWRQRFRTDSVHLEGRFFRTRTLLLSSVVRIHFEGLGKIVIRSPQQRIAFYKGIEDRDELIHLIVSRIRDLPNLQITGDKDEISRYVD